MPDYTTFSTKYNNYLFNFNRKYIGSLQVLFSNQHASYCTTKYIFKLGKNKFDRSDSTLHFWQSDSSGNNLISYQITQIS